MAARYRPCPVPSHAVGSRVGSEGGVSSLRGRLPGSPHLLRWWAQETGLALSGAGVQRIF